LVASGKAEKERLWRVKRETAIVRKLAIGARKVLRGAGAPAGGAAGGIADIVTIGQIRLDATIELVDKQIPEAGRRLAKLVVGGGDKGVHRHADAGDDVVDFATNHLGLGLVVKLAGNAALVREDDNRVAVAMQPTQHVGHAAVKQLPVIARRGECLAGLGHDQRRVQIETVHSLARHSARIDAHQARVFFCPQRCCWCCSCNCCFACWCSTNWSCNDNWFIVR
jgi:hypothetical protein